MLLLIFFFGSEVRGTVVRTFHGYPHWSSCWWFFFCFGRRWASSYFDDDFEAGSDGMLELFKLALIGFFLLFLVCVSMAFTFLALEKEMWICFGVWGIGRVSLGWDTATCKFVLVWRLFLISMDCLQVEERSGEYESYFLYCSFFCYAGEGIGKWVTCTWNCFSWWWLGLVQLSAYSWITCGQLVDNSWVTRGLVRLAHE